MERYDQAALLLTPVWGYWSFVLFVASLGITCFSAALEASLYLGYITAQTFGWNWGENQRPRDNARFSVTYTVCIFLAALLMVSGLNPLKLTLLTMALTVLILPLDIGPLLLFMNAKEYVGEYRNGWISNTAIIIVIGVVFVIALGAIPLELLGG